jgi:hypothetical protein
MELQIRHLARTRTTGGLWSFVHLVDLHIHEEAEAGKQKAISTWGIYLNTARGNELFYQAEGGFNKVRYEEEKKRRGWQ